MFFMCSLTETGEKRGWEQEKQTDMAANVLFLCSSKVIHGCKKNDRSYPKSFLGDGRRILVQLTGKGNQNRRCYEENDSSHRFTVYAVSKGSAESSKSEETLPSWAKPESDEPPPWARDEGKKDTSESGFEVPFFVYLLASAVTAIAAVTPLFLFLLRISFLCRIVTPFNMLGMILTL